VKCSNITQHASRTYEKYDASVNVGNVRTSCDFPYSRNDFFFANLGAGFASVKSFERRFPAEYPVRSRSPWTKAETKDKREDGLRFMQSSTKNLKYE